MLSFDKGSCHMQSFFVPSQWQFGCKQSSVQIPKCRIRGLRNRGENARMVWIAGWIVGLLTTYMTSVARAAGHWVLRCRDCLGKLLRQQGRARGKRQGRRQEASRGSWLRGKQRGSSLSLERPHIPGISRATHKCTRLNSTIKKDETPFTKSFLIFNRKRGGHQMFSKVHWCKGRGEERGSFQELNVSLFPT